VFAYATYSGGDMTERVGQAGVLHGLDRTLYYPLALRDALGAPGLLALVVGAVLGGWRARDRSATAYALLTALGGVALLGSLSYGVDRYATPAIGVLAMLAAPLAGAGAQAGRLWLPIGATLVLAGFAPVLQSSAQRFWPGAPSAPARYDHPAASAAELAWPSTSAYGPSDFNVRAWKIDEAVAALRAVHGRDDGTVGLLLPGGPEVPSYGLVLQRAARLGYRWDVASVNLQWRPGDTISQVFLGPLFDGEWPSGAFTALYAVETPDVVAQARSWLQQQRAEVVTVIPLERGARGVIYRLDFRPAIDRAAEGSAAPAAPR
jgi:hypothetical protein